jgi:hypothetical protein
MWHMSVLPGYGCTVPLTENLAGTPSGRTASSFPGSAGVGVGWICSDVEVMTVVEAESGMMGEFCPSSPWLGQGRAQEIFAVREGGPVLLLSGIWHLIVSLHHQRNAFRRLLGAPLLGLIPVFKRTCRYVVHSVGERRISPTRARLKRSEMHEDFR